MVFGFLKKGKVELNLNKMNFTQGEVIEGNVKMQLDKPIQAKGFFVTIFAEVVTQNVGGMKLYGGGRTTSIGGVSSNTQRAFEFKQQLDTKKEYGTQPYEYSFKINVPSGQDQQKIDGPMGSVASAVKLFTIGNQHTKWFVEAKLDVPKGFDISKKVQINIG